MHFDSAPDGSVRVLDEYDEYDESQHPMFFLEMMDDYCTDTLFCYLTGYMMLITLA